MYNLKLSVAEAQVIDWLLYPGAWNLEVLDYLQGPQRWGLRLAVGYVIIDKADSVELSDDDLKLLLTICPIVLPWGEGGVDVGYELKKKLFKLALNKPEAQGKILSDSFLKEVEDAIASRPSADDPQGGAEGDTEDDAETRY